MEQNTKKWLISVLMLAAISFIFIGIDNYYLPTIGFIGLVIFAIAVPFVVFKLFKPLSRSTTFKVVQTTIISLIVYFFSFVILLLILLATLDFSGVFT